MGPDRLQNRLNSFNKSLLRVVHDVWCSEADIDVKSYSIV